MVFAYMLHDSEAWRNMQTEITYKRPKLIAHYYKDEGAFLICSKPPIVVIPGQNIAERLAARFPNISRL